jgi:hypothetical protein
MRAFLPLCIPNLCNPLFTQSEDCLNVVLLRAFQEKSEDSPFHMKQRHNVQFTSEEANRSPSHCFEKCVLFRYDAFQTFTIQYSSNPKTVWMLSCSGCFKKNPKILLSAWNSVTMSNPLPKKQIFHHRIASRNALYEVLCRFFMSSWPRPKIHIEPTETTIKW